MSNPSSPLPVPHRSRSASNSPIGSPTGALLAPLSSTSETKLGTLAQTGVPFGAKRVKSSELVWDNVKDVKIVCLVDRARGFGAPGEFFAKLTYHPQQSDIEIGKTKKNKVASAEPAWRHTFFFTATNVLDIASFRLEVRNGNNKCKGFLELPTLSATSTILEGWFPLKAPTSTKKNAAKYFEPGVEVFLRMLVADPSTRETYPLAQYQREQNPGHTYFYNQFMKTFKTGDLLLFSSYGLVPAFVQVNSGSSYSSVGMIVELTHKYTEELELYVFEITRNLEEMVDAFSDVVRVGCTLLPLQERLHRFHGSAISWLPLLEPIPEAQQEKLFASLWSFHRSTALPVGQLYNIDIAKVPSAALLQFFHERFSFDPKTHDKYAEIFSAAIVASLLNTAGVITGQALEFTNGLYPSALVALNRVFGPPVALRSLRRDCSSFELRTGLSMSPPSCSALAFSSSNPGSNSSFSSSSSSPIPPSSPVASSSSSGEVSRPSSRPQLIRQPTAEDVLAPVTAPRQLSAQNTVRVRVLALDRVCHGEKPDVAMLLGFAKRESCPFHSAKQSVPGLQVIQHDRELLKLDIAPHDRSPTWSKAEFVATVSERDPVYIRIVDFNGVNDHLLGQVVIDNRNIVLNRREQWYLLSPKKHATSDEVMGRILLSFVDASDESPSLSSAVSSALVPSSSLTSSSSSSVASSSTSSLSSPASASSLSTRATTSYDLELHLIQGKDLLNKDLLGTSDPYAVMTCRSTGETFKSRKVDACLNPQWGQAFRFRIPSTKTAADLEFKIDVWDKDLISDDHMGTLHLSSALMRESVKDAWFPLTTRRGQPAGEIQLGWQVVQHDFDPNTDYHRLQVEVISAENIAMNKFGAYVTLWLKGWNITTFQTFPDRDTLNPTWNMEFFFTMDPASKPVDSTLLGELWTATGAFSAPKYLGSLPDLRVGDLPLDTDIVRDFQVLSVPKKCKPKHLVPAKGTVRLKLKRTIGKRWPPNNSALAIHIRFFDVNEDGVITEEEIRAASEQMGFSPFISWVLSKVVLPLLPTDLFSALSGVRHKDAKLFRLQDGTFDEAQFEQWFHESAHDPSEGLSFWDIVKASWKIDPTPAGLLAGLGELGFVYLLKAKNSRLSKQDLEEFITGELFIKLTAARRREGNLGFYANDIAAPVFH